MIQFCQLGKPAWLQFIDFFPDGYQVRYNALLEACAAAPLPSYDDAIKEPVFAPPAYSAVIAQPTPTSATAPTNRETATAQQQQQNADPSENEQVTPESSNSNSSSSGSEEDLLPVNSAETVTSVEVHQPNEDHLHADANEEKPADE
ncbi:unnamed protein product [Gongylonema pulchrum]|uniref:Uncharacterized protein n=1 Tax=Gongylonema pulchrum TaxID=637853 RepID=A0A3P6QH03_9BILA|nr:unnamed protein product [Gongylonema pulchrum]